MSVMTKEFWKLFCTNMIKYVGIACIISGMVASRWDVLFAGIGCTFLGSFMEMRFDDVRVYERPKKRR